MSYIVVYQRADGSSGLEECADLDRAAKAAEHLRNHDSVHPRIFRTEEVFFDFKPYYRVDLSSVSVDADTEHPDIATDTSDAASAEASMVDKASPSGPVSADPARFEPMSTGESEPAAPQFEEIEEFNPSAVTDDAASSEFPAVSAIDDDSTDGDGPRRGLFGR